MILALVGAIIIGLSLGLIGSGGSILTIPVLVFILDRPEKLAVSESLAIIAIIAIAAVIPYALRKQIDWRSVFYFGLPGIFGASFGAWGSYFISGWFQLILFSFAVMGAASFMLFAPLPQEKLASHSYTKLNIAIKGALAGSLAGLIGMGGGFLIVPTLVIFCQLSMPMAIGTSLVIIVINATTGFIEHLVILELLKIHVSWFTIVLISSTGILGSIVGALLSKNIHPALLKKIFGCSLLLIAAYTLYMQLG